MLLTSIAVLLLLVALGLTVYWLSRPAQPPVPVAVALLLVVIVELLGRYPGH